MILLIMEICELDFIELSKNFNKFNNCNIWKNNKIPDDYHDFCNKFNTNNWIDIFYNNFYKITINLEDWIKKARNNYLIQKKLGNIFNDDIDSLVKKIENKHSEIFNGSNYHVRTDYHSLKGNPLGIRKYNNFRDIIIDSIKCSKSKYVFKNSDKIINFYLIEWKIIDPIKEFRFFVFNSKLTAVSQGNIYQKNNWIDNKINFLNKLNNYYNYYLLPKLKIFFKNKNISECVIDVYYDNKNFHFIEINPFGKEYSSGSCLFDWIKDENILYGKTNKIVFRITN